jgi:hypothetical protein
MSSEVVVWNLDARHRPELDVDIEIIYQADELPGTHYAQRRPELEVELELMCESDDLEDLSALAEEIEADFVPILSLPPRGYAVAYRVAASGPPSRERRRPQRILRAARQGDPQARISLVG